MIGRDALDPRVMQVMAQVPRDKFVPPEMKAAAFDNGPLPIGHGQTISQPYIVALMTDLLKPTQDSRVLEIGTGSGYGAAVLAELAATVVTVETIGPLAEAARRYRVFGDLFALGADARKVRHGFDADLVLDSADEVDGLAAGGTSGAVGDGDEFWIMARHRLRQFRYAVRLHG